MAHWFSSQHVISILTNTQQTKISSWKQTAVSSAIGRCKHIPQAEYILKKKRQALCFFENFCALSQNTFQETDPPPKKKTPSFTEEQVLDRKSGSIHRLLKELFSPRTAGGDTSTAATGGQHHSRKDIYFKNISFSRKTELFKWWVPTTATHRSMESHVWERGWII